MVSIASASLNSGVTSASSRKIASSYSWSLGRFTILPVHDDHDDDGNDGVGDRHCKDASAEQEMVQKDEEEEEEEVRRRRATVSSMCRTSPLHPTARIQLSVRPSPFLTCIVHTRVRCYHHHTA